jgi:4'-phosphopantetheinyl transferase EntD
VVTPSGLLTSLLPRSVASYDTFTSASPHELPAIEAVSVRRAVPKRRAEFATGRSCARRALAALGLPDATVPVGPNREPCWPAGVVGSITHAAGYCAAAVARQESVLGIGIDAEPDEPLPPDVLPVVTSASERQHLVSLRAATPDIAWCRLLFAAKEAVYKAWYPRTRSWLGFDDVEVFFHPEQDRFTATVPGLPTADGAVLSQVTGAWTQVRRLVLTAVVVGHGKRHDGPVDRAFAESGRSTLGANDQAR